MEKSASSRFASLRKKMHIPRERQAIKTNEIIYPAVNIRDECLLKSMMRLYIEKSIRGNSIIYMAANPTQAPLFALNAAFALCLRVWRHFINSPSAFASRVIRVPGAGLPSII